MTGVQTCALPILPTLAAMVYKYSMGQPMMYPRNDLNYAENFLHMMFNTPCEIKPISPVLAKAMDKIFILHADHEQNASTSTVRLAGSSGANPFACIAAGIAALWGPAHGGDQADGHAQAFLREKSHQQQRQHLADDVYQAGIHVLQRLQQLARFFRRVHVDLAGQVDRKSVG